MLCRLILPDWRKEEAPELKKILEGEFTDEELLDLNDNGYNIHYLPNYPSQYDSSKIVDGSDIDTFEWVFVDMDLKDGVYRTKEEFIEIVLTADLIPSKIIDSGNGVHAYWRVSDLNAMSYLKLQRRLMRKFKTDEAVAKIFQLMRPPGFVNTKHKDGYKECKLIFEDEGIYTCEQVSEFLAPLTKEDEDYCNQHYDKTYSLNRNEIKIDDTLPFKFHQLLASSKEVKEIWKGNTDDRSKSDYRLAHIMCAENFSRDEAMSVLVNCPKALSRAPIHRQSYALNIIEKIYTAEDPSTTYVALSNSVADILRKGTAVKGTRLQCWEIFDGTENGFRLTQVLGLIGGSGSGKTTLALNYFYWFTKRNPEYIHVFVSLEQPEEEIAQRWSKLAGNNTDLHNRVHVLGNYNSDGSYRNLSLFQIETYLLELEKKIGKKIGAVVIDHIGVLKKESKDGEAQGLIDICHDMKAFAKRTNTFLVMQSQTSREKAGIGDLELDKDAAYGTSLFEWYTDHLVTTWQPLKRVYYQSPKMTCSAFKYCKIRHKNVLLDKIKEDVVHVLMFDPNTERLSQMTEEDEEAYDHLNSMANTLRNKDRKREPTRITKIDWVGKETNGKVSSNQRSGKGSSIT